MREKRKFFYTLVGLILALIIWGNFYYYPLYSGIILAETEMKVVQTKIKSVIELGKNIDKIRSQRVSLQNEIRAAENRMIDESSINNLVNLLKHEMQKYHIQILAVSPIMKSNSQPDENEHYRYIPLDMKIESRFFDLANFLDDLNQLSFILEPEGISISPKSDTSDVLTIDLRAKILVKAGDINENI